MWTRATFCAWGAPGIRFGLPKLLAVLERYGVKATFFIPGAVVKCYPEAVASIVAHGHEIGCHGNNHEILAHMTAEEQRKALMEARELLTEAAGKAPLGFRMPEGEISEETLVIAKELGFTYSSSLSDDDVPYVREISGLWSCPSTGSCSTCLILCSPSTRRSLRDSPAARGWTMC